MPERGVQTVKRNKSIKDRIVMFIMVICSSLLMLDDGENEFPVFAYAGAAQNEENGSGLLLEQTIRATIPLLGYGFMPEKEMQDPEDDTTCRTLTTEDLISEELVILPQDTMQQQENIPLPETEGEITEDFIPPGRQLQIDLTQLTDYETLVRNFYVIDANTMVGSDQLAVDKLMGMDMTLQQERDAPQILIYHTHSQEAFADSVPGDSNTSIVGVGEYLTKVLTERYGYQVIHHTGQYDVETRDNAYSKALPAVEQILEENPSLQVIIDLHRDEVAEETRLVTEIDGKPTAKFMFFNGLSRTRKTGNIDYLYNENQEANLAFSFQMQLKAAEYYPGLTRRIYLKGYRYNMHLRPRTLLVELGAQNNTVEEAKNACDPLAYILDMVLSGRE